ncbi:MAG: hypothetical protein V3S55_07655 [Nitrospiraceae bacterium]
MADNFPIPLPGTLLVPRLLAYEVATWCENEENQGLIVIVIDSEGTSHMRISDNITAADIAFAGLTLQDKALRISLDPDAPYEDTEGEEDEE